MTEPARSSPEPVTISLKRITVPTCSGLHGMVCDPNKSDGAALGDQPPSVVYKTESEATEAGASQV